MAGSPHKLHTITRTWCFTLCSIVTLIAASETGNFEIQENNDTLKSYYVPLLIEDTVAEDEQNIAEDETAGELEYLEHSISNAQNSNADRGAFYYASNSDTRQYDTSVHVFIKSDKHFGKKKQIPSNSNGNSKDALVSEDRKPCIGDCSKKSRKLPESELLSLNKIPATNSKDVDDNNASKSPVDNNSVFLVESNMSYDLNPGNDKDLNDISEMNHDLKSVLLEKESASLPLNSTELSDDKNNMSDYVFERNETVSNMFNSNTDSDLNPEHNLTMSMENTEKSLKFLDDRTDVLPRSAAMGEVANDSAESLLPSESAVRPSGPVSRLPLLPSLPLPEKRTVNDDVQRNETDNDRLREIISHLRSARTAVVFTEDDMERCETNDGQAGTCAPITECKAVLDTYRSREPFVCRWKERMPVVCCPIPTLSKRLVTGCGVRKLPKVPRKGVAIIAGGERSEIGAWPWMAGIYTRNFGFENFLCGAAIINEKHLVTAAHCFSTRGGARILPTRYAIRVGSNELKEGTQHLIEAIIVYPEYLPKEHYNDIAIIRLKEPMNFETNVRPICLPSAQDVRRRRLQGRDVTVTGWGDTEFGGKRDTFLREVTVKVVDVASCDKSYEEVRGSSLSRGITRQFICAGVKEGGKDACQRDSGGPLMLPENSVWYLVGVVSFGFQCAREGYPGVYTRVTDYLDWLEETAGLS